VKPETYETVKQALGSDGSISASESRLILQMLLNAGKEQSERTVTVSEACAMLDKSRRTVERWIKNGEIPARKVCGRVEIKQGDINKIIQGRNAQ